MGHGGITKEPQSSVSWSAGSEYVTHNHEGHVPITQGTTFKFLSTSCPQGASRTNQHMWGYFISLGRVQVAI